jgi:hypothetical protein
MTTPPLNFIQLFLLLLPCLFIQGVHAQHTPSDPADAAIQHAISVYAKAAGPQSPLYNGVQYRRYPDYIHNGHPFFKVDSLINGTVTFDGVTFENVRLQYDEVKDQLITTDLQGDNLVLLPAEQVSSFSIGPHVFTNTTEVMGTAGYYRLIYNGPSTILAKEVKSIQVKPGRTTSETERSVYSNTDYYLKTPKGYRKIDRLNTFLSLMGSKRKAVAEFIRKNRLRYRTDREHLYLQAATYYDQLTD